MIKSQPKPQAKFMVFIQGHEAPKAIHTSYKGAEYEARRLAHKFPDEMVYVVKIKRALIFTNNVMGEVE